MRDHVISTASAAAPASARTPAAVPDATVSSGDMTPVPAVTTPAGERHRVVSSAYWIVDPGAAKQSQDWIYAGPSPRHPGRPRRSSWPGLAAFFLALACLVAILPSVPPLDPTGVTWAAALGRALEVGRGQPLVGALLAAAALYVAIAVTHAVWRIAQLAPRFPRRQRASSTNPATATGGSITITEATETAASVPSHDYEPPTAGTAEDEAEDAALTDEQAASRQAWEGRIPVRPPPAWPDRPLVVAIADGVGSGLRPADMARVATRTAWRRTFYHLHDLAGGAPASHPEPWLFRPTGWPPPGPTRDALIVRAMSRAFADANAAVIACGRHYRSLNPSETRSAATTLSLLALDGQYAFLVHIGDCSVHHVRGASGAVEGRQAEHNRAAVYAEGDPIRYAEAREKGLHNVLTRWLGMSAQWLVLDPQIVRSPFEVAPGDALVLCSDGLDKHVSPARVARAAIALDAPRAARRLVDLANHRGGSDHIAVAVLSSRGARGRVWRRARLALWREDARRAVERHAAAALGLLLAGSAAGAAAFAALSFATYAVPSDAVDPAATATPLPIATPALFIREPEQAAVPPSPPPSTTVARG